MHPFSTPWKTSENLYGFFYVYRGRERVRLEQMVDLKEKRTNKSVSEININILS